VPVTIESLASLDARQQAAVLALAESIERADGAPPLSDQSRTQLGSDRVRHLIAIDGGAIAGYAQRDGAAAELLGEPAALDPMLDALLAAADGALELWVHGTHSRLAPVFAARGYQPARVLWQLRWPVTELAPVQPADGVTLREFVVGVDEPALVAVNAAAFAHHPEQGGWTLADVTARESEPWFDAADIVLADGSDGQLLGFHWTKRHSASLGEVYVLAVAPIAQGLHLGTTLLVAGLAHLRAVGIREVLLYVDDSNTVALALYEKYGFQRFDSDTQYRVGG
jgi:mycothiol synthase